MTKHRPSLDEDPPRWIERSLGRGPEDRAGDRLRGARPLALPAPSLRTARRAWERPRVLRRSLGFAAIVLIVGIGIGVAGASGAWLARAWKERVGAEDRLEVPRGSVAHLRRFGRWRAAVAGPAVAVVSNAESGVVRLEAGTLTLAADEGAASVEVAGERVLLERGAVATLAIDPAGRPETLVVEGHVQTSGAPVRRATERERAAAWQALAEAIAVDKAVDKARPDSNAPVAPSPVSSRTPATSEDAPRAPTRAVDEAVSAPAPRPAPARPAGPPTVDEPAEVLPAPVVAPALAGNADSETALLAGALAKLRHDGDAGAALALLDRDLARHPDGALVSEVTAVRVEALLARSEDAKALETLDTLPTPRVPLDRRLRALRGELRAKAGRCAEAKVDFSATLRTPPSDAVDERALRGRAACAALEHDAAALRADLDTYVRRFPDRPFAEEARRRLEVP